MEYLDSIDYDVSLKAKRVRSWYLYEQFRSLERNQLDAARQLKDRSSQERILRRELSERKARRNVYEHPGLGRTTSTADTASETTLKRSMNPNCPNEDSFLYDDLSANLDDSSDDSQALKYYQNHEEHYQEEFKGVEEQSNHSPSESVTSVLDIKSDEAGTADREEKLNSLNLNFEEVKAKLHCIERMTKMRDENCALNSFEEKERKGNNYDTLKNMDTTDNNVFLMWTKLVSFAYQMIQLNHGTCYYDYGSQVLTAVLLCDVLRRAVNRPYVSPIKFATDSTSSTEIYKNNKRKKLQDSSCKYKNRHRTRHMHVKKYRSDFWDEMPLKYTENDRYLRYGMSEPCDMNYRRQNKSSYHTIWPLAHEDASFHSSKKLRDVFCKCCRRKIVVNPMLRLSQYLDNIMKDIDDPSF